MKGAATILNRSSRYPLCSVFVSLLASLLFLFTHVVDVLCTLVHFEIFITKVLIMLIVLGSQGQAPRLKNFTHTHI